MELSVKVFAIAKGEDNLKKMYKIMQESVPVIEEEGYYLSKKTQIAGWVELEEREYDVWDRDDWDSMLENDNSIKILREGEIKEEEIKALLK